MREILFRAKRLDNGEWVEGIPIQNHIGTFICFDENPHYCHQYGYMEIDKIIQVDPETVCQYTGETDKNGQKIWENDIIDASDCWWNACGPAGHSSPIILVEWSDYLCGYDPFANYDCDCGVYIEPNQVKVIGNIFDNPELLKGGTE